MSLPAVNARTSFFDLNSKFAACLTPAILLMLLGLLGFGPGGDDDTHITYTASASLVEEHAILNNSGEFVEQGSSLLHVLTLSAFYKLATLFDSSLMIADIGPVFSLLIAILCLPLCWKLAYRLGIKKPLQPLLLLSLSLSFSYWSMGGLESSLAALCFLYWVLSIDQTMKNYEVSRAFNYIDPHFFLSLLCFLMVRPESAAIILAFLVTLQVVLFFQRKLFLSPILLYIFITTLVLFGLICAWRYCYFGQILPQPVYAKADGLSLDKITAGFLYFIYAMQLTLIIYVGVILWVVYLLFRRKIVLPVVFMITLSLSCAYLAFIVASGGDWMTGGRFFVPIVPLLVCLLCFVLQGGKWFRAFYCVLCLLAIAELVGFMAKFSLGVGLLQSNQFSALYENLNKKDYSWSETANLVHVRDIPTIDALSAIIDEIERDNQRPLLITSIQMGMVPYHLSQQYGALLKFVDMRGLTSQDVTQCSVLANSKRNWLGVKASYYRYFSAIEGDKCPSLIKPDIVYDLLNRSPEDNRKRLGVLYEAGYHLVYLQSGAVTTSNKWKQLDAKAFIVVSDNVYQQLSAATRSQTFDFSF